MAKRYIDTGLYDDPWFMDLSKDSKILFTYYITKCSHAGLLELNEKLCKVQTGITDIKGALEGLQSRLITVKEGLFFMPKFLFFQYPKFPQSAVYQQRAALEELTKLGLFKDGKLDPQKPLLRGYVDVDVYANVDNGLGEYEREGINIRFETFWNEYDKKVGPKDKIQQKWEKLSDEERIATMKHLPAYKKSQPNKQYRLHPETYLNQRGWNHEIITAKKTEQLDTSQF